MKWPHPLYFRMEGDGGISQTSCVGKSIDMAPWGQGRLHTFLPTPQRPLAHSPYLVPFGVWAGALKFNPMSPVVGLGQGLGGDKLRAQSLQFTV